MLLDGLAESDATVDVAPGGDAGSALDGAASDSGSAEALYTFYPMFASGSRLKARHYTAPDAPPFFQTFHDEGNGHHCRFVLATDGRLRCLPVSFGLRPSGKYVDSKCRASILHPSYAQACFAPTESIATVAVDAPAGQCPAERFEARRLKRITGSVAAFELDAEKRCVPAASVSVSDGWIPDEVVAPTEFVAGTEAPLPSPGSLTVLRTTAEDGAFYASGIFDVTRNTPCSLEQVDEIGDVCLPVDRAGIRGQRFFADTLCQRPLAYHGSCTSPKVAVHWESSVAARVFAVGSQVSGEVFRVRDPSRNVCSPVSTQTTNLSGRLFEVGSRIENSSFESLRHIAAGPSPTIKLMHLTHYEDFTPPLMPRMLLPLGYWCSLVRTLDKGIRCPRENLLRNDERAAYFRDRVCQQRMLWCDHVCQGRIVADERPLSCGSEPVVTRLWKAGSSINSSTYYKRDLSVAGSPCEGPFTLTGGYLMAPDGNVELGSLPELHEKLGDRAL